MIDGVTFSSRRCLPDERGAVWHMLKRSDPEFEEFGEIYFSGVYPGVIKGWHRHTEMHLNYCCIVGMVKIVLYDSREDSPTYGQVEEVFLGEQNYGLLHIPPNVTIGMQGLGQALSLVANCATLPHDPSEIIRLPLTSPDIPYTWHTSHV